MGRVGLLASLLAAPAVLLGAGAGLAPDDTEPVRRPIAAVGVPSVSAPSDTTTNEALYRAACAACHGADGTGASRATVGFEEPLPDFTDCSFASREPDADWAAVVHEGGPVRGFSPMMPAFGDALTDLEVEKALAHVRDFCPNPAWPRGELNLPRPLFTEKAYPEDETVLTTTVTAEGPGSVMHELVYERRFGARNQLELVVPFGFRDREAGEPAGPEDGWVGGLGDLGIGVKRALLHSLRAGSILSAGGEVLFPTGDEEDGFGKGTTVFEPFLSFGQILPADGFLHLQGGFELPADGEAAEEEAFWRLAVGRSLVQGRWGRTWSPMVELLGARALAAGEPVHWDLVPQLQVTLNTRQHVMANLGVRIPLDDPGPRRTEFLIYLLWDWFDGGFFEGW